MGEFDRALANVLVHEGSYINLEDAKSPPSTAAGDAAAGPSARSSV